MITCQIIQSPVANLVLQHRTMENESPARKQQSLNPSRITPGSLKLQTVDNMRTVVDKRPHLAGTKSDEIAKDLGTYPGLIRIVSSDV
jgi:hypothetical protein